MVYYGLTLASPGFGGNVYVNFAVNVGIEVPAFFYVGSGTSCIGRLWSTRIAQFVCAIALLLTLAVPKGLNFYQI